MQTRYDATLIFSLITSIQMNIEYKTVVGGWHCPFLRIIKTFLNATNTPNQNKRWYTKVNAQFAFV